MIQIFVMNKKSYLKLGSCWSNIIKYPQSYIAKAMHRFNSDLYQAYDWLEYSEGADATYSLTYYIFKGNNIHQGGEPNSVHNQANRKYDDLMQHRQSIHAAFDRKFDKIKLEC